MTTKVRPRSRTWPLVLGALVLLAAWSYGCGGDEVDVRSAEESTVPPTEGLVTLATLAPGVMSFDTFTLRFEIQLLLGPWTGPVMSQEELSWLPKSDVGITEAKGYKFADGELAILFFVDHASGSAADTDSALRILNGAAAHEYAGDGRDVWCIINGDFGFVVASKDGLRLRDMGAAAQTARAGVPLD